MLNIAALAGAFKSEVVFSMGCHSGLNAPDSYGGTRRGDWAQTFAGRGTAVFVGNTGYGYGDFKTVALSERLMKLFAQNLDGNFDVGRALLEAKRDYYLSAGNYQGYDEKVLQQAVFYGLPMYHIDATPPAAPDRSRSHHRSGHRTGCRAPLGAT